MLVGLAHCLDSMDAHRKEALKVYKDVVRRFPDSQFAEDAKQILNRACQADLRKVVDDGYPMRSVFRLDHHRDAVALLPGSFDMVLLVWPNIDTPFGEQVAHAMRSGQVMILEGEEKGVTRRPMNFSMCSAPISNASMPRRWRSTNITARSPVCTTGGKY